MAIEIIENTEIIKDKDCHCKIGLCEYRLPCNADCCHCIDVVAAVLAGEYLQIQVKPQIFRHCQDYSMDLCVALPDGLVGTEAVQIVSDTDVYSLSDTNGDPVPAGRLRGKSKYCVRFSNGGDAGSGTYPKHFTIKSANYCRDSMRYDPGAVVTTTP